SSSLPGLLGSPSAPGRMPKGPRQRPAERYRLKYSRLRRAARALVFENGALCDEVARLEAKCLRARDERRFLLTRLLQLRAMAGPEEITGEVTGRRPRRGGSRGVGPEKGLLGGGGPYGGEATVKHRVLLSSWGWEQYMGGGDTRT
uniref:INO80 complex subunit E N-terminal domain-containing protein n=1 Tax=Accipiter nisus TaxID=211598 RepID=A0A8B9RV47_9AVES